MASYPNPSRSGTLAVSGLFSPCRELAVGMGRRGGGSVRRRCGCGVSGEWRGGCCCCCCCSGNFVREGSRRTRFVVLGMLLVRAPRDVFRWRPERKVLLQSLGENLGVVSLELGIRLTCLRRGLDFGALGASAAPRRHVEQILGQHLGPMVRMVKEMLAIHWRCPAPRRSALVLPFHAQKRVVPAGWCSGPGSLFEE